MNKKIFNNVTIVLCAYYSSKKLKVLIPKINKKFNILIIDNSKQYKDKNFYDKQYKNVRYHIPKKDSGLSASYNLALKTVKTPYIFITQPDVKFSYVIKNILNLTNYYKQQRYTLDSFMKLFFNLYNYLIKNKEKFVNFSMEKFIMMCTFKYEEILSSLFTGHITGLVIHKKSTPVFHHVTKMIKLQSEIKKLNIKYQIETTREELINTNINIHMLSEIYIKSENSKDILPVFCKGIDKHILSFVVGN
jgi:hypothetical protein